MMLIMYYKRNNKCLFVSGRGDYISTFDFIINITQICMLVVSFSLPLNDLLATIARNVAVLTNI